MHKNRRFYLPFLLTAVMHGGLLLHPLLRSA